MDIGHVSSKKTFEVWVNEFSDELFSWALYKTSCKETAEDLVQETFLSAYNKIKSYEGKSQPKTWLFSILNNKIIDYYRKKSKRNDKDFSITENSGIKLTDAFFSESGGWKSDALNQIWDQEEQLLDNRDFIKTLASCMDELPQKWKVAITSKYLTEKNAVEICQDLQITMSNYWQIVHRAKLLLKTCLETKWL